MAQRPTAKDAYWEGKLPLPPGYGLEHGSVAAAFGEGGAAPAEVARTAEEDRKRNGKRPARDRPLGR